MGDDRWTEVEELFLRARELPEDRRAAFVRTSGADGLVRREVLAMLRADMGDRGFRWMARAAAEGAHPPSPEAGTDEALPPPQPRAGEDPHGPEGRRIGRWLLRSELGRGGMGRVYLAERDDDQYEELVAVKIMRSDFDSLLLEERFRAERQILAELRHPSIATLLDGGITPEGRPYLVMQYEPGLPITEYCDEHALSIEERLDLFARVCDAVHFAHTNLVVHRDLKPSNILVDETGHPKLLDFGIAKILEGGLDMTRPVTRDVHMFSPDHAAPEQVRGGTITTATDVYALGILLYELLVGERPFRAAGAAPAVVQRRICEEAPRRPSDGALDALRQGEATATSPAELRSTRPSALVRTLRGDLDQIVLKALRKEPESRYASAGQMADDVRRHLAGLPVQAHRGSTRYRLGKFVRRHRLGVGTGAAVAALSVAFVVVMAVQSARLARERDRTQEALVRAEEVSELMIGLFEAADPQEEPARLTAEELLERGTARAGELADQPAVQAQLLNSVGRAYRNLGRFAEARPLLERALEQRRALHGDVHEDVAASLNALADLELAQEGDLEAAEALILEMAEIFREIRGPEHPDLAIALMNIGALQFQQGAVERAEASFQEALAIVRDAPEEGRENVARVLNNLALAQVRTGDLEGAEASIRESLALNRARLGEDHPDVGRNLNILGEIVLEQGRAEEAEALYRDVLERRIRLYGADHPAVATVLNNLAQVLRRRGRPGEAIPYAERGLAIQREVQGDRHPRLATGLKNLGRLYMAVGRHAEAEEALLDALDIYRDRFGEDHEQVDVVQRSLADLYTLMGQDEDAARYGPAAQGAAAGR